MNAAKLIRAPVKAAKAGSILVVAVCTTAIIGAALVVYLQLASNQHHMTMRSQVWNSCMAVLEAGIEEALTHATKNFVTNMAGDGWTLDAGRYVKTNRIGEGFYNVSISETLPYEIISTGYLPAPYGGNYVSRTVRVVTLGRGVFVGAIVVKNFVELNGNNVKTDSYDSRDSNKSTAGRYDPLKAGDKGDVACTSGLIDSVNVGNANVWGKVLTGPGATVAVQSQGAVGSVSWHRGGNSGIEPGWRADDFNVSFPDAFPPFGLGVGSPPGLGTSVDGVSYGATFGNGNYQASTLSGNVLVTGNATVYVTGSIAFGGSDVLQIAPGASLKIYCAGPSAYFGSIINPNELANSFIYYGMSSNGKVEIKGNAKFTGVVYAPNADVTFVGGIELFGAVIAESATLTGSSQIHYDEAVTFELPVRGFEIASWNEI
ncbi:MAG: hypothetical protein L0Y58_16890 [Verrucomicrobia subdivision 3 bacterium]|nr:hypothetical protein [Limisphaerales bacterium]